MHYPETETVIKPKLFQWRSISTRVTLFTLVIFLVSILALGFYASRVLREDMQRMLGEQQFSAVSVIGHEINDGLTQRVQALESIAKQVTPAVLANAGALQSLLEQRPLVQLLFNAGAFTTRTDGVAVADVPGTAGRLGVNYLDRDFIASVLTEGKTSIGRPVLGKQLHAPVFSMAVPIRDAQGQVIGVLAGITDLNRPNFLDQIANSQYGKTGGYLLIAPQHKLFVTASDKSRALQPVPAPGLNAMHDRYMQGYEGFGLATSSRGVLELSAAKGIPAAGWFIAVTLPALEAFAPIDHMLQRLYLGTMVLTVLAAALIWWLMTRLLQQQFAPLLAATRALSTQASNGQSGQALPVVRQDEIGELISGFNRLLETSVQREAALIASQERWRFAIEGAGYGLWDWNIQTGKAFYSPRYKSMLGYCEDEIGDSAEEWSKRIHPEDSPLVMAALQPYLEGKPGSAVVEFRMLCKDSSWQWTMGRGMVMERDAQGKALRVIGTNTDITVSKQTELVDRFLAKAGAGPGDEPFFAALARFLAQSLQMDYVCIDRLEGDALKATTLAVWHDGHFEDNVTYALRDTPCGEVVEKTVCCYPASVCQFFPQDTALQELRAESYVGVTLWGHSGTPIGLIAVIGRRALSNRSFAEATLARVAVRAAGELERLNAEATTRRSESRFRGVFEKSYAGMSIADAQGTLLDANDCLARMLGYARDELTGMNIARFTHADDLVQEMVFLKEIQAGQRDDFRMNKRYWTRQGALIWVDLLVTVVRDAQGEPATVFGLVVDISERLKAQSQLELAANVFSHAREGITITNAEGTIVDVNEAFTRITGYSRSEAIGQNPSMLSSGRQDKAFYEGLWRALLEQGHWSGEIWNRRKDGEVFAELLTISAVRDAQGCTQHYVALFSDITAIKEHQNKLDRMAHFDALTGLPNRLLLADRLQQGLAQAARRGQTLAVAYLDLDGFKAINDQHGHDVGDQLLVALATRMKQALREGDTLARLGGDEFVAVLSDLTETQASVPLLNRLLAAAAQPVSVGSLCVRVSASLGVTFYPQPQDIEPDQLLRQADQAMYQAKLAGKNRYHVFDSAQDSHIRGHHESLERIRQALGQGEFVLHYQPKVNMRSGLVVGVEALIRWQHPERGLLAPAVFLPVVENDALAIDIGEWVIDTALTQIERWRDSGLDLGISVNVGARQLQQANFVDRLQALLAAHPEVRAHQLELEVLETSALEDITQVSQVIEACAMLGVAFALDDFGTGYSSLTYLKRLRVSLLKIDQSFVRDMLDDPDDLAILEGVIGLAAAFRRDVIAEGVETAAHGRLLLHLGCQLGQGFGIARPMSADQLPAWVASWQPDEAWV